MKQGIGVKRFHKRAVHVFPNVYYSKTSQLQLLTVSIFHNNERKSRHVIHVLEENEEVTEIDKTKHVSRT